MADFELCCECDGETGRAGAGEDSLYAGDKGPYCENCWYDLPEKFAAEIARLRAELAEAREQIELAFWEGVAAGGAIVADDTSRDSVKKRLEERWQNSSARAFIDRGAR